MRLSKVALACSMLQHQCNSVFLTAKDTDGNWKVVVDESCQTPIDHVWNTKASGWVIPFTSSSLALLIIKLLSYLRSVSSLCLMLQVYALSKLLTENAAFQFAYDKGVDFVSVITTVKCCIPNFD